MFLHWFIVSQINKFIAEIQETYEVTTDEHMNQIEKQMSKLTAVNVTSYKSIEEMKGKVKELQFNYPYLLPLFVFMNLVNRQTAPNILCKLQTWVPYTF